MCLPDTVRQNWEAQVEHLRQSQKLCDVLTGHSAAELGGRSGTLAPVTKLRAESDGIL